ncbi:MAG: undecaprenyldiphospho-muramoylpentapeptide beta-N-acetylglucosaminyltransferase [Bryobacteraceae bacterium]
MAFVFAGGGTGGHVVPALAVAREMNRRGDRVLFIGTREGIEAKLVPEAGFSLELIEIGGLQRVGASKFVRSLWQLPRAVWHSMRILDRAGARAVFSMGGFVAGPVVLAAVWRRIPVVAMEPNAIPGFVNRAMGRFLERVLTAMPGTESHFPEDRCELTGVPVREAFFAVPPPAGPFTVLITGGSQGSRTLNRAFRESWPIFQARGPLVRFLHQAGPREAESLARDYAATGLAGEVTAFIPDMPAAFADAHLIVGRAGANAVAELTAAGRPSILVPFPFAADDHQTANAAAMERAGAAIRIRDAELTGERFHAAIETLAADPVRRDAMASAAKSLARPGAAARAAELLREAAKTVPFQVDTARESRNN